MADAKQGKPPLEDFYNGSSQSRVVLAKPRLGAFGSSSIAASSSKSCNPFSSVLRPSQLKPGSNPFLKVTEPQAENDTETKKNDTEDRTKDAKEEVEAPKFVPLESSNVTPRNANPVPAPPQPTASSSSSGFVFGQNLSERVVIQENVNNGDAASADVDHSSTNGTTELLFTSAAASVNESQDEAGPSKSASDLDGLAAAAAEYERSHARPPPPAEHCHVTGEEGEINVLQISCRLFAWESGSWRERGRGVLRLNDAAGGAGGEAGGAAGAARLVVRVAGSLRVALNTKLWPDMVVDRAGTKSIRITATDAQHQIKLFLIMGAPADVAQLYRALSSRVAQSKRPACALAAGSQQAAERLEAAAADLDFLDKPLHDADSPREQEASALARTTDDDQSPTKPLKRKEPLEHETSPKRQCPEVSID